MPRRRTWHYPSAQLHSTTPRTGHCHTCQLQILTCYYQQFPLHLDPQPLNLLGEIETHLKGDKTFFITNGNLWLRTAWAITTSPHGLGGTIHRPHHCGRPQPTDPLTAFPPPTPLNPPF